MVLAAACLTACGAGAGSPSSDARLLVTADFGDRVLVRDDAPEVRGADTVMRLVQRNAKVTTRYGGGFVQSIDGLAGGQRGGRPVDWFFYVDGVLSDRGAAQVRVGDGDAVWWDHHDWGSGPGSGSAVVGSFPAPFTSRRGARVHPGDRARVRDDAAGPHARGRARPSRSHRRRSAAATSPACSSGPPRAIRDTPRRAPAAPGPGGQRRLRAPGPRRAARSRCSTSAGHRVRAAGAGRRARRRDAHARARLRSGPSPAPTTRGSRAAAGALTQDRLAGRFAVAVEGADTTPLPLEPER